MEFLRARVLCYLSVVLYSKYKDRKKIISSLKLVHFKHHMMVTDHHVLALVSTLAEPKVGQLIVVLREINEYPIGC